MSFKSLFFLHTEYIPYFTYLITYIISVIWAIVRMEIICKWQ